MSPHLHFNPRTPCGVRLVLASGDIKDIKFQSTHPLRGATVVDYSAYMNQFISIHAPLAGCDARHWRRNGRLQKFQSTHPLRGATWTSSRHLTAPWHFNPRTPCGVRPMFSGSRSSLYLFQSTHPLRGATLTAAFGAGLEPFQSTHPLRGATITSNGAGVPP